MHYTISDFYHTYESQVHLIAGSGGMTRTIINVGILDYEMVSDVRNRYLHSNFHQDQFVISSFLYARDDSYLIQEAIKHLIAKGSSGLAIKNVFHLAIPESVIRYADSKDFPIFLITAQELFVEDLVYDIKRTCQDLQNVTYQQENLSLLVSQKWEEATLRRQVKKISPSCGEQYYHVYINMGERCDILTIKNVQEKFLQNRAELSICSVLYYQNGILLTVTAEDIEKLYQPIHFEKLMERLSQEKKIGWVGISGYHLSLAEYKTSVIESLYACQCNCESEKRYMIYEQLGVYQILLPYHREAVMQQYKDRILESVLEYDIENKTQLYETLHAYINAECQMKDAAAMLGQHVNTVRYRLECITQITGFNYKKFSDLLQLSLAIKLREIEKNEFFIL